MFCKKCGKQIEDGRTVCLECEEPAVKVEEEIVEEVAEEIDAEFEEVEEETEEVLEEELEEKQNEDIEVLVETKQEEQKEEQEEQNQKENSDSKKMGILSLCFGFASLFVPLLNTVTAVLAIIFGACARKTKGADLGIVGLVAGICYFVNQIAAVLIISATYLFLFIFAFVYAFLMAMMMA